MRIRTAPTLILAALAVGVPTASAADNSVPTWDRHFLLDTAEGAHFEIDMGKIAARHGHSAKARSAGRLMVKDHEGELHAVEALAKSLGVKVPKSPSALERHEISDTSRHQGAAFDRAYARLEVGDHIMDIETADGENTEGGNNDVKAFATKYREVYKRHLAVFRALAKSVHAD